MIAPMYRGRNPSYLDWASCPHAVGARCAGCRWSASLVVVLQEFHLVRPTAFKSGSLVLHRLATPPQPRSAAGSASKPGTPRRPGAPHGAGPSTGPGAPTGCGASPGLLAGPQFQCIRTAGLPG
ncbi:hypothetical protein MRX96_059453 [Rhipicephalus microplus]